MQPLGGRSSHEPADCGAARAAPLLFHFSRCLKTEAFALADVQEERLNSVTQTCFDCLKWEDSKGQSL